MTAPPAVRPDGAGGAPGRSAPGAVIEASALTKRYPNSVIALDQLTVAVAPGVTGLVGANGAGKSTLIKILLGLLPPTSGRAAVLGLDCATEGTRIRTLTGYMPEHDCLPPDISATEFVTHMGRMSGLPATAAKERAADSLRHVGLYEERYRQIGTYSTGMKQRVKLAQALAGDPRLLLLDEPTNGLDPAGRTAMLDLIARIGTEFGISIVVASHLLGEIEQICDHLVAIEAGGCSARTRSAPSPRSARCCWSRWRRAPGSWRPSWPGAACGPCRSSAACWSSWPATQTYDVVRDAVADLGLPLNRMEQRRHRIEELFRDDPATASPEHMHGSSRCRLAATPVSSTTSATGPTTGSASAAAASWPP